MLGFTDIINLILNHWILSLLILSITLIYIQYVTKFGEIKKLGLPGPTPMPLVGNISIMLDPSKMHIKFDELTKKYGKIFGFYMMKEPMISVSDPQMLKEIMVKEFNSFHDLPNGGLEFTEPMNSIITNLTGDRWKNVRSVITPAFTTGKLKDIMSCVNQAIDTFLGKCKTAAETNETIDIYEWMKGITLETILSSAFGVQSKVQTNPNDIVAKYAKQSVSAGTLVMVIAMIPIIGPKMAKYIMPTDYGFGYGKLTTISEGIIKQRKQQGIENNPKKDILQLMLASQDPDRKGYKLTDNEVIAQSLGFLIAGYETSSITLGIICYHLVLYPEVQDKVQEELDRVCSGGEVDYESLQELVYLEAVIAETQRVHPPAWTTMRKCTESCEIGGVQFKKGMGVLIPTWSLHHDEKYWDDAEEFRPERFLPGNKESIDPFTYMPFGQGPRNCVGMRFALLEIKLVLARLLKEFRIQRAAELHVPLKFTIKQLYAPDEPVYIKIVSRKQQYMSKFNPLSEMKVY